MKARLDGADAVVCAATDGATLSSSSASVVGDVVCVGLTVVDWFVVVFW